jgi:hypothetical protein
MSVDRTIASATETGALEPGDAGLRGCRSFVKGGVNDGAGRYCSGMAIIDRLVLAVAGCACAVVIGACGSSESRPRIVDASSRTYHDAAGWSVRVPTGWRVARFVEHRRGASVSGAVFSNVKLPAPDFVPGYPIQINDYALPAQGIGLVIANDLLRSGEMQRLPSPPLPSPDSSGDRWIFSSGPAPSAYLETLNFHRATKSFVASAKIGLRASRAQRSAMDSIITSLR